MKRKNLIILAVLLYASTFVGCSFGNDEHVPASIEITEPSTELTVPINEPEISTVRAICEMATLECYFNNVAKSIKQKGTGITHWGEKDRVFWVEYVGIAKIGIDMSQVTMTSNGNVYTITIPQAEIQSITIDQPSFNEDSYIISKDGFNSNEITAEDQINALKEAKEEMIQTIRNDANLLINAQDRAKRLIENYFEQLGKISETDFEIRWVYEENVSQESDNS